MIFFKDKRKFNILITGVAGFIGYHLAKKFILNGFNVIGLDSINNYYDVNLKKRRLKELINLQKQQISKFIFFKEKLENFKKLDKIFKKYQPKIVINLAAQAGVRYSLENPQAYVNSNIVGFVNILECSKKYKIDHLLYASSSSVYGGNTNLPFSEKHPVDHPISLYAATKKSNELLAHTYSHLYKIPSTGLRFFTAYGPWGRPDMALYIFTEAILKGKNIKVYNHGNCFRDFTYIDDVVESVFRLSKNVPKPDVNFCPKNPTPFSSLSPHIVYNVGNSESVKLIDFINILENVIGIEAKKIYLPSQPGDVERTSADTNLLEKAIGFKPKTPLKVGIKSFVDWYIDFYK